MLSNMNASQLPDVSSEPFLNTYAYPLDWVGMENIALPIRIQNTLCTSKVNAYVSLDDPLAKGIHMSRLYTRLLELHDLPDLTLNHIHQALDDFLTSHTQLTTSPPRYSSRAELRTACFNQRVIGLEKLSF